MPPPETLLMPHIDLIVLCVYILTYSMQLAKKVCVCVGGGGRLQTRLLKCFQKFAISSLNSAIHAYIYRPIYETTLL